MSYEGYDIYLCKNGHLNQIDVYDPANEGMQSKCYHCGETMVWCTGIDTTNDDGEDQRPKLKIKHKCKVEVCKHCGNKKIIEPETYHIPKKKV